MKRIKFIDVTLRDGQQSLWATRMTNDMFMPFLSQMDRVGFEAIDLVGGAVFDVCVRYLQEDPWQRMRLAAEQCRLTPLNVWSRGQSLFTFELFSDDIVELAVRTCARNGIRRYTTYDALNDIRNIEVSIRAAKESGMSAIGHVVYNLSPVHTDQYFARKAREVVALGVDGLGLKDPSGLLTPERARVLLPILRKIAGSLPFELHSHCRSGLGELVAIEAAQFGVDIIHTGVKPLASGDALPDCRYVVKQLRRLGFTDDLSDSGLNGMETYFTELALQHDKPFGMPNRYDPFLYHHQIPGGMISNLYSQLNGLGMEHRLQEVLEEVGRVREDLGYPILVSPFAQFVVTQSVMNVVGGRRYGGIPDEVARYVLGEYGEVAGPINPEVQDRVQSMTGRTDIVRCRAGEGMPPRIETLRETRGPFRSDEELLLAAFYQQAQLDPLILARNRSSGSRKPPSGVRSVRDFLEQVKSTPTGRRIAVSHHGSRLEALI